MKKTIISINIPTFNSEKTLKKTLDSIVKQNYKNYEIVIVDHYSTDKTLEIAKKYTKNIFMDKKRLLGSRRIGANKSKGEIILVIDSDQVLEPTLLKRIEEEFSKEDIDMAILEERSYQPQNLVEKMTDIDRQRVHESFELDPSKSVLLPRAFRKKIILAAFDKIDKNLDDFIVVQDHAILYHESWKISKKIGFIKNAVFHMEPNTFREVFQHYYAWGKRSKASEKVMPAEYREMFNGKLTNRLKSINWLDKKTLKTLPLTFIKGLGFKLGLLFSSKK